MKRKFRYLYLLPALVTAIVSFILCMLVSQYTMKAFNITVEFVQLLCALVSFVFIAYFFIKRKEILVYRLMLNALGCFLLGELYWVLHIYIKGYEQLGTFSISDLSWVGFYIFLLYITYRILKANIVTKSSELKKYNLIALIAPALIIAASTVLYLTGDDLIYTLLYCIPTSFLGFYILKSIILPNKTAAFIKPYRLYHIVVGLIIILDNLSSLVINFGYTDTEYIAKFCFAMLLLLISPAIHKGVEKWSM